MYLVTKVYCSNEWAETPDLFVIELTKELKLLLKHYAIKAQKLRLDDNNFLKLVFHSGGDWINNPELCDTILDGDEYLFLDKFPQEFINEEHEIRGHKVSVFHDGDICFSSYNKHSGEDFDSVIISLDKIMKPKVTEVQDALQGSFST